MRLVHVDDVRVVDCGEHHLMLALAGGARHGDPSLRVVGAKAADRTKKIGLPQVSPKIFTRVSILRASISR